MKPININNVPTEYLLRTKAGNLWKCGKESYRKDWNKLKGVLMLIHNKPFTLKDRVKKNGKWYLVFTDEKYIYTEQQTKALKNKKFARDITIETDFNKGLFNKLPNGQIVLKEKFKKVIDAKDTKVTKQTEQQLLLPAPKELIDKVVEETQCIISDFRQAYIKKYNEDPHIPHEPTSDGIMAKLKFIFTLGYMGKDKVGDPRYTVYRKELIHYYHPDRGNVTDDIYIRYIKLATDSVERIRKHDMFKLSWYL